MSATQPENKEARRSLAMQIRDQIRAELLSTEFEPGSPIPSEPKYAERFGVSRPTVREAFRLLEQEGLVRSRQGKGRFLTTQSPIARPITRLEGVTDLLATRGYEPENVVLDVTVGTATEDESRSLGLGLDEAVVRLRRARYREGVLLVYSVDVFSRSFVSGRLADVDWTSSLFAFLEGIDRGPAISQAGIRADTLAPAIAKELKVKPGDPWLVMDQLHFDANERPVLLSVDFHRADSFTFNVVRTREA